MFAQIRKGQRARLLAYRDRKGIVLEALHRSLLAISRSLKSLFEDWLSGLTQDVFRLLFSALGPEVTPMKSPISIGLRPIDWRKTVGIRGE
jgi:hypothetical protein